MIRVAGADTWDLARNDPRAALARRRLLSTADRRAWL